MCPSDATVPPFKCVSAPSARRAETTKRNGRLILAPAEAANVSDSRMDRTTFRRSPPVARKVAAALSTASSAGSSAMKVLHSRRETWRAVLG
jgi:hypothetical protein